MLLKKRLKGAYLPVVVCEYIRKVARAFYPPIHLNWILARFRGFGFKMMCSFTLQLFLGRGTGTIRPSIPVQFEVVETITGMTARNFQQIR